MNIHDLPAMVQSYIETALWSTHHTGDPEGGAAGTLYRLGFTAERLAEETRVAAERTCADFWLSNADDLIDMSAEQVGRDFWLTRERHGAGFWDRDLAELGDRLTDSAHDYGSADWFVGADDLIYGAD